MPLFFIFYALADKYFAERKGQSFKGNRI
jgi:hypothetical protein